MSRLDDLGEILGSYDEQFQHTWKAFLEGFEEKYCSVLNAFDDKTKRKLISGYHAVKENSKKVQNKDPVEIYYTTIKSMIDAEKDNVNNQAVIYYCVEAVEEFVRSLTK